MNQAGELKTGYGDLLRMAIPISMGTMLQFFVLLTDNFFLARLSEEAINGAGNAGLVYMTLEMIAVGSGAALQIVIARRLGEGRRNAAMQTFRSGLLLHGIMGLGLMFIGMLLNSGPVNSAISDPTSRFHGVFLPSVYSASSHSPPSSRSTHCTPGTGQKHGPFWPSESARRPSTLFWMLHWWKAGGALRPSEPPERRASFCAESTGFLIALMLTLRVMPEAFRPWSLLTWERPTRMVEAGVSAHGAVF